MIAIGVMSGTSLDGIDAALVRLLPRGNSYEIDLLNFEIAPFEPAVRKALRDLLPPRSGTAREVAELHNTLGVGFAQAARRVAGGTVVDYVASHGQTIYHDGETGTTLQIGNPFFIRDAMQATTCFDFRSADCVAGGHGAPLVPYVDALLLASDSEDRVAVNIGGIANLTVIPRRASPSEVIAFDTGPGNMLLDAFVRDRTGGAESFDRDGRLAQKGNADATLLKAMLADAYFSQAPPKSTGREHFGEHFLADYAHRLNALSTQDGAATLAALTAQSIADCIASAAPKNARVFVSGGGANNAALLGELQRRLRGHRVERSDVMKLPGDAKEAVAFAVLGYETLRGRSANVPRATGAERSVVLGAIAPFELAALLQKVQLECRG